MSDPAIERLRGRIEALELISITVLAKVASEESGMRQDVAVELRARCETPVKGLSPVALMGFRELLGQAIELLDPQSSE